MLPDLRDRPTDASSPSLRSSRSSSSRLCELLGRPELAERQLAPDGQEELAAELAAVFATRPLAAWLRALRRRRRLCRAGRDACGGGGRAFGEATPAPSAPVGQHTAHGEQSSASPDRCAPLAPLPLLACRRGTRSAEAARGLPKLVVSARDGDLCRRRPGSPTAGDDTEPDWSPDRRRIAVRPPGARAALARASTSSAGTVAGCSRLTRGDRSSRCPRGAATAACSPTPPARSPAAASTSGGRPRRRRRAATRCSAAAAEQIAPAFTRDGQG